MVRAKRANAASAALTLCLFVVLVACSNSLTVSGRVLDRRTGKPVAGATVSAGTAKATSSANGRFRLDGVPKSARLTIVAANYRDGTVAASAGPLAVKLEPIPVAGMVKSAFTKKGIVATISSGGSTETSGEDGRFSIYGVGPGDHLSITAFAHTPATATVPADRTINVSLKLGTIRPRDLLKNVAGYGSKEPTKRVLFEVVRQISKEPRFGKSIVGVAGKTYTKDGKSVAVAVAVTVAPSVASRSTIRDAFIAAVAKGAPRKKTLTISGIAVHEGSGGRLVVLAWQRYTAFVVVFAPNERDALAIAKGLIATER